MPPLVSSWYHPVQTPFCRTRGLLQTEDSPHILDTETHRNPLLKIPESQYLSISWGWSHLWPWVSWDRRLRHKPLFWGICGALAMKLRFSWCSSFCVSYPTMFKDSLCPQHPKARQHVDLILTFCSDTNYYRSTIKLLRDDIHVQMNALPRNHPCSEFYLHRVKSSLTAVHHPTLHLVMKWMMGMVIFSLIRLFFFYPWIIQIARGWFSTLGAIVFRMAFFVVGEVLVPPWLPIGPSRWVWWLEFRTSCHWALAEDFKLPWCCSPIESNPAKVKETEMC